jgi:hypothetical protein
VRTAWKGSLRGYENREKGERDQKVKMSVNMFHCYLLCWRSPWFHLRTRPQTTRPERHVKARSKAQVGDFN